MAQSLITSLSKYFFLTTKFHLFNSYIYNLTVFSLVLFLMSHFYAFYVPIQGLSGQVQDMSFGCAQYKCAHQPLSDHRRHRTVAINLGTSS